MTVIAGPTQWWYNSDHYYACFAKCNVVGSATYDGSHLVCKAGGIGWFVAPSNTQVIVQWAGGQYNSTVVGNKCCISEWSDLKTALENRSRPIDITKWFVPSGGSGGQLYNPGFVCRLLWDCIFFGGYWSSTEITATNACNQSFTDGSTSSVSKTCSCRVRAFRCTTY
jgi:hypothetical protein